MARELQSRVVITADDRTGAAFASVSSKLRQLANSSRQVKSVVTQVQAVETAMAKARKANDQLGMVKVFRDAGKEALAMGRQHREALTQLRAVGREMNQIGPATLVLRERYKSVREQVAATGRALAEQKSAVRMARDALQGAGVNVDRLASSQRRLEQATKAATAAQRAQAVNPWGAVPRSKSGVPLIPPPQKAMPSPPREARPLPPPFPAPARPLTDLPVGEAATGLGAMEAAKRALLAGADVDTERSQARQAGWTDSEIAQAEKAANQYAGKYGVSPGAALNIIREGRPTFGGSLDTTLANIAPFFDVLTAMRQKSPNASSEENNRQLGQMIKAGEILGYSGDPAKLREYANFMTQMVQVHGSALRGEEVLNFAKSGKSAASGVTFDYLKSIFPTMLPELGGDRLGTASMTLRQALVGGKMKKRAAENLADLGIIDRSGMIATADDDVKGVRASAVKGAKLVEQNPLEWVKTVLVPAMDAKGIKPEDRSATISTLFSDRNAEYLVNLIVSQMSRLAKDRATVDKAKGLAGAQEALRDDPYLAAKNLAGNAANLGAALADPLIGPLKDAANAAAAALTHLAESARGDRPAAATGVLGGGLLGALGGWLSTQGSSLWWRGAAAAGGAGGGALVGGAALPLAVGAGRSISESARAVGGVAAGRYYTPTDTAAIADLEAKAAALKLQMDQIASRIHPSRRAEPSPELDRLALERQETINRANAAKEQQPPQSLTPPAAAVRMPTWAEREGEATRRTDIGRIQAYEDALPKGGAALPNLADAMKNANVEAKLEGSAEVKLSGQISLEPGLMAKINQAIEASGHLKAGAASTSAGSTGKTMTEAGGD